MSVLLRRISKLRFGESRRSTFQLVSSAFSSSPIQKQTPPYTIIGAEPCGEGFLGRLIISYANAPGTGIQLEKKVPGELLYNDIFKTMVTIGSSHGWVATLKEDGILRLQDDLNPTASHTEDPKHIPLPPLVTLPHCQTQIVTNVSMSSPSPEDENCVVAVKFLGPQLSFCRPGHRNSEWTNIRVENPCFFSSRVMFSKKDEMFCIPGSGGQLMGSWDLRKQKLNIQRLQFKNLPELTKTTQELLDSCCTIENLVESVTTGETFMVKQYKKTAEIIKGVAKMKTEYVMVLKLDEEGNAVYTRDIGDLCMFISRSEPFCVPATSLPGTDPNFVYIRDFDEFAYFNVADYTFGFSKTSHYSAPYYIPPQNID